MRIVLQIYFHTMLLDTNPVNYYRHYPYKCVPVLFALLKELVEIIQILIGKNVETKLIFIL